jgi:hypothetical protein
MTFDPFAHRKTLSFEEAAGIVPLPTQLRPGELSQEFRAVLWAEIHRRLGEHAIRDSFGATLNDPWDIILQDEWVYRRHKPIDEFPDRYVDIVEHIKTVILAGSWGGVLGWVEFVLKHPACPQDFATFVDAILKRCRMAYAVFDSVVICPIGSEAEAEAIKQAFVDVAAADLNGAQAHLRNAASHLTAGHYPDSVRESVHAVEAVARVLEPTSKLLSEALARLERSVNIHGALKKGFNSLYAYTSDENGIRHALLDDPMANVDETDALFMLGACAAFVSYLINKARSAGLLAK